MIQMYVILKVTDGCLSKQEYLDLLDNHSFEYCRSKIDVNVNAEKGHVCIDYDRYAESINEAIEDISYELTEAGLIKYFKEMGRG